MTEVDEKKEDSIDEEFDNIDIDNLIPDDEEPVVIANNNEPEIARIDKELDSEYQENKKEIEVSKKRLKTDDKLTDEYIKQVIYDFLKHYKKKVMLRNKKTKEITEEEFVYYDKRIRELTTRDAPLLVVNFRDIIEYRTKILDKQSISNLIYLLTNKPYTVEKIFVSVVKEIFKNIFKVDTDIHLQSIYKKIQVGFSQFQDKSTPLNTLRSHDISKFITTEGVISQYDEKTRVNILKSTWSCNACSALYTQKSGKKPAKCFADKCYSREFTQDMSLQESEDYMDIRLTQQFSGTQKNNTADRYVRISGTALVNYVLNNISPGSIAIINGVVTVSESDDNTADIELDASYVEHKNNVNIFDYDERLLTIVKDYINETNINQHVDKLIRSVCAHLYKQEKVKEAILLQMVGTNARRFSNNSRKKGDLNIILGGNSGKGKSEYGTFVQTVLPLSIKAGTAGSTTVAGLTTFVETNPKTGKKMISLGVLALCDEKGVAIIEEINRRNKKDLGEFTTAADDTQEIFVNKGGFHSIIHSRCPILATANSLINGGVWDFKKTFQEQAKLDRFILDRIDLIFIVDNDNSKEYKEKLISHIEASLADSMLEKDFESDIESQNQLERTEKILREVENSLKKGDFSGVYPVEYLRHEIHYLKTIDCQLLENSQAYKVIKDYYSSFSDITEVSTRNIEAGSEEALDKQLHSDIMGIRQFNTLTKMAEIYGRLYRCKTVGVKHAQKSIDMMTASIKSILPRSNSFFFEDDSTNEYARRMLNKSTLSSMTASITREEQEIRRKMFRLFDSQLKKFNNTLYAVGYKVCKKCHGTGKVGEMIDSEFRKVELYDCNNCVGQGGERESFTYLDFEASIMNLNIMADTTCKKYFKIYRDNNFLAYYPKTNTFKHNIDLKSPDVTDSINDIVEKMVERYMEQLAKKREEDMMKNRPLDRPRKIDDSDYS